MEDYNELIQQRFKKLAEISAMGKKPYGGRFDVTTTAQALIDTYGNTTKEDLEKNRVEATIAGRVVAMRSFGKACFSHLSSDLGKIQLYFQKNTLGEERFALFQKLEITNSSGANVFPYPTRSNELTLDV